MNKFFNRVLAGLVGLTFLALYVNANWMDRSWRVDLDKNISISAVDDRAEGGKSVAKLEQGKSGITLHCRINEGYQWKFCELDIRLSKDNKGIDLRDFEAIRLAIRVKGPGATHPIRVFLRNFDPAYSTPTSGASLKPHEVLFDPTTQATPAEFKLSQFMVSSWWTQEHPLGNQHIGPQLDHVTTIGIATPGNIAPGDHEIVLESVEFIGHWISAATFRLAIILFWVFGGLCYLVFEWKQSRDDLRISVQLREELRKANEELELRVDERTRALSTSNSRLIESLQNLDETRKELVQNEKNAALGSLVSGIAHELNTPIGNAVLVSSTLSDISGRFEQSINTSLSKKALYDYIKDVVSGTKILSQNLERAAALISSFKQISADQHSGQQRQFKLKEMIDETVLTMKPRLDQTTHLLALEIEPGITMDSTPGPLSQIIIIFINNALLHAFDEKKCGQMRLQARRVEPSAVELQFSDDGAGIPAAILRRVFEPFFTTKLGKGGSGLGMHLAYNIVTQVLCGKIDITSTVGQGTTITLTIPLNLPQPSDLKAKVGIPKDVLDDYVLFLDGRNIKDLVFFGGNKSRRDVVELAIFLQAMQKNLPQIMVDLISVDSYAEGLEQLREGSLSALATTLWHVDLIRYEQELIISEKIILDGQSIVGIYTRPGNRKAIACQSIADLRSLQFASNSDWSSDWETLKSMGVESCVDIKTWRQMVYSVSGGEVDAILAPFPSNEDLSIEIDGCRLVPISNQKIALHGSRHFAVARNNMGKQIAASIFPILHQLIQDGRLEKTWHECGFFNQATSDWTIINM